MGAQNPSRRVAVSQSLGARGGGGRRAPTGSDQSDEDGVNRGVSWNDALFRNLFFVFGLSQKATSEMAQPKKKFGLSRLISKKNLTNFEREKLRAWLNPILEKNWV